MQHTITVAVTCFYSMEAGLTEYTQGTIVRCCVLLRKMAGSDGETEKLVGEWKPVTRTDRSSSKQGNWVRYRYPSNTISTNKGTKDSFYICPLVLFFTPTIHSLNSFFYIFNEINFDTLLAISSSDSFLVCLKV